MFKKQHIKYFSFYILICLIIICIGSITGDNANTKVNEVSLLGIKDAVYIFILNSIQIIFWFLLAPFGLSIPFILKFIYSMGLAPHATDFNILLYYFSSVTHGLGEIIISFIVLVFTIKHIYYAYLFITTKQAEKLIGLYKSLVVKYIPSSLIILLVSALAEVYISNRIAYHMYYSIMLGLGAK